MKKKTTFRKLLPLLFVPALVLSACSDSSDSSDPKNEKESSNSQEEGSEGDGSSEGSDPGAEGTEESIGVPAVDVPMADRADMQQGGNLNMAISGWPDSFNQYSVAGNTGDVTSMFNFAGVLNWIYDAAGDFEPNPNFVESYDVQPAEGDQKQVVTLKLNPKAVWNDGSPIDANDYITLWKACSDQIEGVSCASSDGWNEMESVAAGADDFEVVVTFTEAYPDWSANLGSVFPADGLKDAETFDKGWLNPVEVSKKWTTGPFKFTSGDKAEGIITLEPNENWWGDKPMLDKVTFRVMESTSAQAQAFANQELDVVEPIISADNYETVKGRSDAAIKMAASVQWRHYTLNSAAGALKDVKVRQAIQYAIDRADVTASDLAGLPVNGEDLLLGNHFFMPFQSGYQDNSVDYDPEMSKQLLTEAGYTFNDETKMIEKDGEILTIMYLRMPEIPTSNNEGLTLQSYLKDVGVNLQFTDVAPSDFFDAVIGGEYEICTFTWVGTAYPMANVGQIYGDPAESDSNFANLKIDKVDELIPEIAKEMDVDKRRALTNEADQAIWDAVHTIPIYNRAVIVAQPENLVNYGSAAFMTLLPENIGYKK